MRDIVVSDRLGAHLGSWLGAWPPVGELHVVGSARRTVPGWDGRVYPALGIAAPGLGAVLSVPPEIVDAVRAQAEEGGRKVALAALPQLLGAPGARVYDGAVFRWSEAPTDLPDAGTWVAADADGVPDWLRPFGGEVLVAVGEDGAHLAGVGIKAHDEVGRELAVVTAPAAEGRGLARRLVAQAARRVLAEGRIPTYLHAPDNHASAHVADAAGFHDVGWTALGVFLGTP